MKLLLTHSLRKLVFWMLWMLITTFITVFVALFFFQPFPFIATIFGIIGFATIGVCIGNAAHFNLLNEKDLKRLISYKECFKYMACRWFGYIVLYSALAVGMIVVTYRRFRGYDNRSKKHQINP